MTSHRADHRSTAQTNGGADSEASGTDAGSPGRRWGGPLKVLRVLPSAATLVGAVALVLAATGALVSQPDTTVQAVDDFEKFALQASVLNAASSIGSGDALSGRERAVSRDSRRESLQQDADAELQAVAETQAKKRSAALAALAVSAEKRADKIAQNGWVLPVAASSYRLTSRFGDCSSLWSNCHTGLDFAAPTGTPIAAVASGVVTSTGYDGAYGNKTVVKLEDGTEVWYCHQNSIDVSVGSRVSSGQRIGTVGATGNVTGPHLHLEIRPGGGDPVNPESAASVRGVRF